MKTSNLSIPRLFGFGSPSGVFRFVISVRIWVAVNRMRCGRSAPHIGQEIAKSRFAKPSLADCYSKSAVVIVMGGTRIKASRLHVNPSSVFRCPVALWGFAVRSMKTFGLGAPAADGCSANQMISDCRFGFAAIAQTNAPISTFRSSDKAAPHHEQAESHFRQIFGINHGIDCTA